MTNPAQRSDLLALVDDLRSSGRISGLEARALTDGLGAEPGPSTKSVALEVRIRSLNALFDALGGTAAFGRAIGKGQSTASEMKRRGSIPIEHWPAVIAAGREVGVSLGADKLLAIHLGQSEYEPDPTTAEWLSPREFSPAALRVWVARVCEETGMTQSALAKAAGVQPSTINRFMNDTDHDTNLSATTIDAIITAVSRGAAAAQPPLVPSQTAVSEAATPTRPDEHDWRVALREAASLLGSQAELAQACGIPRTGISRVLSGERQLLGEEAVAIERATDGRITRGQLRPDLWPAET